MSASGRAWVVTCEHASCALPREYRGLGLPRSAIVDHIGWDPGARALQREVGRRLGAACVASRWSRLLVDCNRAPDSASLILARSDGVAVPGNRGLSRAERRRRIDLYHRPYHEAVTRAVDRALRRDPGARLLSLHSFTPVLAGEVRRLDVGVLFDEHPALARQLGRAIAAMGYRVRYNEPYSGLAGLIYSARRHGLAAGIEYVELEVNNALLRSPRAVARVGRDVARAIARLG